MADVPLSSVISLAADSRGRFWLSDREFGVFASNSYGLTTVATPPGTSAADATFVYVDRRDRLWMGFQGATVVLTEVGEADEVHALGTESVPCSPLSMKIRRAQSGSAERAAWPEFTAAQSTSSRNRTIFPGYGVFAIIEDVDGHIWLGVSSGIVRLKVSDFERAARQRRSRLTYRFYDVSDGLVGVPSRQGFPGAVRTENGTFWFNDQPWR